MEKQYLDQLVNYMKSALDGGLSKAQVEIVLQQNGWKQDQINEGFLALDNGGSDSASQGQTPSATTSGVKHSQGVRGVQPQSSGGASSGAGQAPGAQQPGARATGVGVQGAAVSGGARPQPQSAAQSQTPQTQAGQASQAGQTQKLHEAPQEKPQWRQKPEPQTQTQTPERTTPRTSLAGMAVQSEASHPASHTPSEPSTPASQTPSEQASPASGSFSVAPGTQHASSPAQGPAGGGLSAQDRISPGASQSAAFGTSQTASGQPQPQTASQPQSSTPDHGFVQGEVRTGPAPKVEKPVDPNAPVATTALGGYAERYGTTQKASTKPIQPAQKPKKPIPVAKKKQKSSTGPIILVVILIILVIGAGVLFYLYNNTNIFSKVATPTATTTDQTNPLVDNGPSGEVTADVNYEGICESQDFQDYMAMREDAGTPGTVRCNDTESAWALYGENRSGQYYCYDSTGAWSWIDGPIGNATSCSAPVVTGDTGSTEAANTDEGTPVATSSAGESASTSSNDTVAE